MTTLFPHQTLDQTLQPAQEQLQSGLDDETRLERTKTLWAQWHFRGGAPDNREASLAEAHVHARALVQQRPDDADVRVTAAAVALARGRLDAARRHLEQARRQDPDRADLHYVDGLWHQATAVAHTDARQQAATLRAGIDVLDLAVQHAPHAWEPHALLATLTWRLIGATGGPEDHGEGAAALLTSMAHAVRALEGDPPPSAVPPLLYHLGITCLHTSRFEEASKLLSRLLDDPTYRTRAQYYLGLVHYQMGRYKNAVRYLREHLEHAPESARVYARLGMAHLQLGEIARAREACNRAVALTPGDVQSRWTLGCALLEESREEQALGMFRSILEDAPDHIGAFRELVRAHARRGELSWLDEALQAEVAAFDRLTDPPGSALHRATRGRIDALIEALAGTPDPRGLSSLLEILVRAVDEGVRFALWEGALDRVGATRGAELAQALADPGRSYSVSLGLEVLTLATALPMPMLVNGLLLDESDLRRGAIERHGPASDINAHRRAIDDERREARAWQALLLLAIATHGDPECRPLLDRWAFEADPDLADAARGALAILGDAEAAATLRARAQERGLHSLVDTMVAQLQPPADPREVRAAEPGEIRACAACGRHTEAVAVMIVGRGAALCSTCLVEIAEVRPEVPPDGTTCALTGSPGGGDVMMYRHRGIPVAAETVQHGLTVLDRQHVDRYLRHQAPR